MEDSVGIKKNIDIMFTSQSLARLSKSLSGATVSLVWGPGWGLLVPPWGLWVPGRGLPGASRSLAWAYENLVGAYGSLVRAFRSLAWAFKTLTEISRSVGA